MTDPTCPSCGVPYSEHLGLTGTCRLLREARDYIRTHCPLRRRRRGCPTDPETRCLECPGRRTT